MPTDRLALPGGRDVRASLDGDGDASAVVVACPPHPRQGGDRHDARLRAVSDALDADCLRFDYGPWAEGRGERTDAHTACTWATDRYDRVGLFGYSFGGGVALTAADGVDAVAALAPVARLDDGTDVVAAVPNVDAPLWVGYGTRDDVVDADRVAAAVDESDGSTTAFPAGHGYVGREAAVGEAVAEWFDGRV